MGGGQSFGTRLGAGVRTKSDISTLCLLTAGYTFSKLRISAGLGLSGTVYSKTYQVLFESDFDPVTGLPKSEPTEMTITSVYRYLVFPVTIGGMLPVTRKLTIVPEFGLLPAYNQRVIVKNENHKAGKTTSYKNAPATTFSLAGMVAVNAEYYLTKRAGLTAGISYTQTVTNLESAPNSGRYERTYGAGIGVIFKL